MDTLISELNLDANKVLVANFIVLVIVSVLFIVLIISKSRRITRYKNYADELAAKFDAERDMIQQKYEEDITTLRRSNIQVENLHNQLLKDYQALRKSNSLLLVSEAALKARVAILQDEVEKLHRFEPVRDEHGRFVKH